MQIPTFFIMAAYILQKQQIFHRLGLKEESIFSQFGAVAIKTLNSAFRLIGFGSFQIQKLT